MASANFSCPNGVYRGDLHEDIVSDGETLKEAEGAWHPEEWDPPCWVYRLYSGDLRGPKSLMRASELAELLKYNGVKMNTSSVTERVTLSNNRILSKVSQMGYEWILQPSDARTIFPMSVTPQMMGEAVWTWIWSTPTTYFYAPIINDDQNRSYYVKPTGDMVRIDAECTSGIIQKNPPLIPDEIFVSGRGFFNDFAEMQCATSAGTFPFWQIETLKFLSSMPIDSYDAAHQTFVATVFQEATLETVQCKDRAASCWNFEPELSFQTSRKVTLQFFGWRESYQAYIGEMFPVPGYPLLREVGTTNAFTIVPVGVGRVFVSIKDAPKR